jgi:hypothetical protein
MPADPAAAISLVRSSFLDVGGARWTRWITLLTGRFGVQVPGGAHTRTGPTGPVLGVRDCSAIAAGAAGVVAAYRLPIGAGCSLGIGTRRPVT